MVIFFCNYVFFLIQCLGHVYDCNPCSYKMGLRFFQENTCFDKPTTERKLKNAAVL